MKKKSYNNCSTATLQQSSQQLSLFEIPSEREDPPPYPLQIVSIPHRERIKPQWNCRLVHYGSGLRLGGQFTYDEAQEILETTRTRELDGNTPLFCLPTHDELHHGHDKLLTTQTTIQ